VSDAVAGFISDLERIGRADDVSIMIFSEFGRRVPENVNLGTDHGTANLMFVAGNQVKGGHYGTVPSLMQLVDGNLIYTTDFRRVYASMIAGWGSVMCNLCWVGISSHSICFRRTHCPTRNSRPCTLRDDQDLSRD
jgi:uncharacterized protein (DUF1501 family)